MLTYQHGDVVDYIFKNKDVDVFFHQCNCFNTMGKGVAKDLAGMFPEVVTADNLTCIGDRRKMGNYTKAIVANGVNHRLALFNLYGQYGYRYGLIRKGNQTWTVPIQKDNNNNSLPLTSMVYLSQAIDKMLNDPDVIDIPDCKFATVKIGCGLAGGNWERDVKPMLEKKFDNKNLTVFRF